MPYSYTETPGDGVTTQFPAPDYLRKEWVTAYVDGAEVSFSWLTSTTVEISPAPAAGMIVRVGRVTPLAREINFQDEDILTEGMMDFDSDQMLHIAQESKDIAEDTIAQNDGGNYDVGDRRLVNVADPVDDTDATNKQYSDGIVQAAEAARDTTLAAETNVTNMESNVTTMKSSIETSEQNATTSETNAKNSEDACKASEISVITEGNTQVARVTTEGDTQVARLDSLASGMDVNKSVRQTMLTGPNLEATPSTIKTAATASGNIQDQHIDLGMDLLTGSRGYMTITKGRADGWSNLLQASLLTEYYSSLKTNLTNAEGTSYDIIKQGIANGLQTGVGGVMADANLFAFQTTHKTVIDGVEWHYNPVSGFAMWKHQGNSTATQMKHPMTGKTPIFLAVKKMNAAKSWYTGRYGTSANEYMTLNSTNTEDISGAVWNGEIGTDTYINLGNGDGVNGTSQTYFGFGWFGDPLDDLYTGMGGERGVTASFVVPGGSGAGYEVDTGITDIEMILYKSPESTSGWFVQNKARGWGYGTYLNDNTTETSVGFITNVDGSKVRFGNTTYDQLIIVIGSTTDAPDNRLKTACKMLRRMGNEASGTRIDLGAPFAGGNTGGMVFGRRVSSTASHVLVDSLRNTTWGKYITTNTDNPENTDINIFEEFTTTGIQVGSSTSYNSSTEIVQFLGFPTTHKITMPDGNEWHYNPLSGFAICKYTGNGTAGKTLQHPMGKKLRMGWFKNISITENWHVYLDCLGADQKMLLNLTNAASTDSGPMNNTEPDTDVITLGSGPLTNGNGNTMMFYGWFGSGLGAYEQGMVGKLGSTAFIKYTGGSGGLTFDTQIDKVEGVIWKKTNATSNWHLYVNSDGDNNLRMPIDETTVQSSTNDITVEGSKVTFSGSVDSGVILVWGSSVNSGADDQVILPASVSDPTIVTCANGFDSQGNVDNIVKLTASQSLTVTGSAGKKYIYMKPDGLLYFSATAPEYHRMDIPLDTGFEFDINRMIMKLNGVVTPAVFIGTCMLDNLGNVYDIKTYARGDLYMSDWFAAMVNTNFYFDNMFGHNELSLDVISKRTSVGDIQMEEFAYYGTSSRGVREAILNDLTIFLDCQSQPSVHTSATDIDYKLRVRRNF